MCEISRMFPLHIRQGIVALPWQDGLEEIRVRIAQPMEFIYASCRRYLSVTAGVYTFCTQQQGMSAPGLLYRITEKDIAEMLSYISSYSLYACREEIRQGYITVQGGHRIGVAGQTAAEDGKIAGISPISFLNLRVAHEYPGCAKELIPYLRHGQSIYNTLILSEPGAGKTTCLRDCIRLLSAGNEHQPGVNVCVVDERSEIAACYRGIPQNDVGPRTDVLDGCGKAEGMILLLRAMSPQILAVDELGGEEDFAAVEQAAYSGSRVLGTLHAGGIEELSEKPYLKKWLRNQVFGRFVQIKRRADGTRVTQIYDGSRKRIC